MALRENEYSMEALSKVRRRAEEARRRKLELLRSRGESWPDDEELVVPVDPRGDSYTMQTDRTVYIPTEEEIATQTALIQLRWTDAMRQSRLGIEPEEVSVTVANRAGCNQKRKLVSA